MYPKLKANVTIEHVGDEALILDSEENHIHQLNPTAVWILEHCDGYHSIESIAEELVQHFDVTQELAEHDVRELVDQLATANLVELRDPN